MTWTNIIFYVPQGVLPKCLESCQLLYKRLFCEQPAVQLGDVVYIGQFCLFSIEAFYLHICVTSLEKESQDFPSCVCLSGVFVVHDAS